MVHENNSMVFSFSREKFDQCMAPSDILPRKYMTLWAKFRGSANPAEKLLAEHGKGFMEQATLASDGQAHMLSISAVFDDDIRHTLIQASLLQRRDNVDIRFNLSGIGFHSPENQDQAEKVLWDFGNVLRYTPYGINFDNMCREFKNWAHLSAIAGAANALPPELVKQIKAGRFDPIPPAPSARA